LTMSTVAMVVTMTVVTMSATTMTLLAAVMVVQQARL